MLKKVDVHVDPGGLGPVMCGSCNLMRENPLIDDRGCISKKMTDQAEEDIGTMSFYVKQMIKSEPTEEEIALLEKSMYVLPFFNWTSSYFGRVCALACGAQPDGVDERPFSLLVLEKYMGWLNEHLDPQMAIFLERSYEQLQKMHVYVQENRNRIIQENDFRATMAKIKETAK